MREPRVSHSKPHRFVIIGCGRMGLAHTRRLATDVRSQLTGFYDSDTGAAMRLRDRFAPHAAVFDNFSEALADDIDAVVIATPTIFHYDQITAALTSGRHVLAEKPLAGTRSEIVQLIELCNAHPHLHCVLGYQRRFWRNYQYLKEELASGRWGALRAVTFVNCERWEAGIAGTWRDDANLNFGGFLGDAGSHKLDALMYVTGLQPERLFAVTHQSRSQVEIIALVTGTLKGNIPLTLSFVGNAHSYHEELRMHSENADLILRDDQIFIAQKNNVQAIDLPAEDSGPLSLTNPVSGLLDLLNGTTTNPAPPACALAVFDVTTSILRCATGRL